MNRKRRNFDQRGYDFRCKVDKFAEIPKLSSCVVITKFIGLKLGMTNTMGAGVLPLSDTTTTLNPK